MARIFNEQVNEPLGTSTEYLPRICITISEPIDELISEQSTAAAAKRVRRSWCSAWFWRRRKNQKLL